MQNTLTKKINVKRIGLVCDKFHTELLETFIEIYTYNSMDIILYNNTCNYGNVDRILKKYTTITRKSTEGLICDILGLKCDLFVIITYDTLTNLLNSNVPYALLKMHENILYIAHTIEQRNLFDYYQMRYICLCGMLATTKYCNWILPIKKSQIIVHTSNNLNTQKCILDLCNIIRTHGKTCKVLISIGHFLDNNRDIALISNLLNNGNVILIVFSTYVSETLYKLSKNSVFTCIGLSDDDIITIVSGINNEFPYITSVLYAPPKNSVFMTSQWSGTLSFAIDNDIPIILPNVLFKEYKLYNTPNVIKYNINSDVIEQTAEIIDGMNEIKQCNYTNYRKLQFDRNNDILKIYSGIHEIHFLETPYGGIFTNQFIPNIINLNNFINADFFNNINSFSFIIIIGSGLGEFPLLLANWKHCKVFSFESNLQKATLQKKNIIANGVDNIVRLFNNKVSSKTDKNTNEFCLNDIEQYVKHVDFIINACNINVITVADRLIEIFNPIVIEIK